STGKKGTGIVPICNEPATDADRYGTDRLFVRARVHGAADENRRDALERALIAAHAPFVTIDVPEPAALGAEFVRWEIATAVADELKALRAAVRDRTRAATMFGFGPRYLHSTGQLHKGGANNGVFLLITASPREDVGPIPGEQFSFGTLEMAQAVGDFASLDAAARRAAHAHLPVPDRKALRQLSEMLLARLPATNAPAT